MEGDSLIADIKNQDAEIKHALSLIRNAIYPSHCWVREDRCAAPGRSRDRNALLGRWSLAP
jgi:hypothetical protein